MLTRRLLPFAALLFLAAPLFAQEAAKPQQILISTGKLDLLLLVDANGRLAEQNFGRPAKIAIPAADAGARRRAAPSEDAYPTGGSTYIWEPALLALHADGSTSTELTYVDHTQNKIDDDITETRINLKDPVYPFFVTLVFRTYANENVLEQWTEIHHTEKSDVILQRFASASPIIPGIGGAAKPVLTQFSGKYKSEMTLSEETLNTGLKILDSKLGSRAQYFQSPTFFLAPRGPATEIAGEVFGGTLAWSGSFQFGFEMENARLRILTGMNPYDSAYHLAANTTFTTPAMLWSFSENGKGDISRSFHRWARKYVIRDASTPRPVLLNNWEATGTNFDEQKLASLFDAAKSVNAELFLLDDGWFGQGKFARDNDRAGLGDWTADPKKLPHGVEALAKVAISKGLRFGIWTEPEMTNPLSELYTQHPDWIIRQTGRNPLSDEASNRHQFVLDLTRPEVHEFVFHAVDDLLTKNPDVSYIKWDCNRYITQGGSTYLKPEDQQNLWIDYNTALYDIMARIAKNHPGVEMMACAGGGGRVDYGVLRYFHTFWPSDNTDPLPRIKIQYGFSQFFPAVATAAHVTRMGNRPLKFTYDVAMSEALGMDMDLSKLSADDRKYIAAANESYKSFRDVIITGDLYRLESPYTADGATSERTALDYVSPDQSRAIVFVYQTKDASQTANVFPQGLDPKRTYVIHELNLPLGASPKLAAEGKSIDGASLMKNGLATPTQNAFDSSIIEFETQK